MESCAVTMALAADRCRSRTEVEVKLTQALVRKASQADSSVRGVAPSTVEVCEQGASAGRLPVENAGRENATGAGLIFGMF